MLQSFAGVAPPMLIADVQFMEHYKWALEERFEPMPQGPPAAVQRKASRLPIRIPSVAYLVLAGLLTAVAAYNTALTQPDMGLHGLLACAFVAYGMMSLLPLLSVRVSETLFNFTGYLRRRLGRRAIDDPRLAQDPPALHWVVFNGVHLLAIRSLFLLVATTYLMQMMVAYFPESISAGAKSSFAACMVLVLRETVPALASLIEYLAPHIPSMTLVKSSPHAAMAKALIYFAFSILHIGGAKTLWRLGREKGLREVDRIVAVGGWGTTIS